MTSDGQTSPIQSFQSTRSNPIVPFDQFRGTEYTISMIREFIDTDTEKLFNSVSVRRFRNIEDLARRKLLQLNAALRLDDLRVPPGNRLEALRGNRKGQHSIRVNDQWRVCFVWSDDGVYGVEIVDYH